MKNNEFKNYYNEFKKCVDAVMTMKSLNDLANLYNANVDMFTQKQFDKLTETFDAKLAELTANEMAKSNMKGGKHMSKKKEQNTAPADVTPAPEAPATETAPAPVEVLKGEVIDTAHETEINEAIARINAKVETIGKGYLDICGDVARLRAYEAWKLTGHKNLYELCKDKFGMARGTVNNLEKIFKKYGNPETFELSADCDGKSLRGMLEEINTENKAALDDKNGAPVDGDGNGDGDEAPAKKSKVETLVSISWELAGDDWNVEALLNEIKKQLDANPDAKEAFPDGACVTFTITK